MACGCNHNLKLIVAFGKWVQSQSNKLETMSNDLNY